MFSAFTQALHDLNLPEEDIRVLTPASGPRSVFRLFRGC